MQFSQGCSTFGIGLPSGRHISVPVLGLMRHSRLAVYTTFPSGDPPLTTIKSSPGLWLIPTTWITSRWWTGLLPGLSLPAYPGRTLVFRWNGDLLSFEGSSLMAVRPASTRKGGTCHSPSAGLLRPLCPGLVSAGCLPSGSWLTQTADP